MLRARTLPCLLLLAGLAACAQENPGLNPPGIPGALAKDKDPRLFFPIGLDLSKDGSQLYVANSNYNREFNSGTLVAIPTAVFPAGTPGTTNQLALPPTVPVARLDGFAGELRVSPDGSALFVTTRDNDTLTRVALDATGQFSCDVNKGCSEGAVDLGTAGLKDPFALTFGTVQLPGDAAPESVLFVSHLTPESSGSGSQAKHALAAVIPERVATEAQKPFSNGGYVLDIGVPASDSLVFDAPSQRLYVGGCLVRVSADQVVPCASDQTSSFATTNPLRSFLPASGPGAPVEETNLGRILGGGDTVALDVSSDGKLLYVMTARPSALLVVDKPEAGGVPVNVRSVTPLAATANRMLVLRRTTGDIVVASALEANAVLVLDPAKAQVLAQLSPVGKGPFELAARPTATGDRVFVGLFNSCGVATVDIPADRPFDAFVSNILGGCP